MIYNLHIQKNLPFAKISGDKEIFESLNKNSSRHSYLNVDFNSPALQMCVRVTKRMMNGNIKSDIFGATRFHRTEKSPAWAKCLGYVYAIDDLLFYL